MRDLSTNYILRGSWRDDGSQGLAGLGERIAGLEWMAQEHAMEALSDPDPRVRVMVAGMLKRTNPAEAMAEQAMADVTEMAYPTGKPVVFKRFARDLASRVKSVEAMAAQELVDPDQTLINIVENADDPEGAAEAFMNYKVLQAMVPGIYSDEQIDEMFSEDGLLGKSFFKKVGKIFKKTLKVASNPLETLRLVVSKKHLPPAINKIIDKVTKFTTPQSVGESVKKTFITNPKKAKAEQRAADAESAAAQAEYDKEYAAAMALMQQPTGPTEAELAQARANADAAAARQAEINAQYADAMNRANQPQQYPQTSPPQGYAAPAPSGGGDYESAQPGEAPVAAASEVAPAAPAESGGGVAAMALAAAAGVGLLFLNKGKK